MLLYLARLVQGKDRVWWKSLPGDVPRVGADPDGVLRGKAARQQALFQQYVRHEVPNPPKTPPHARTRRRTRAHGKAGSPPPPPVFKASSAESRIGRDSALGDGCGLGPYCGP